MNTNLKKCSKCCKKLPATSEYFCVDKSRADGLSYVCKECRSNSYNRKRIKVPDGFRKCYCCKEIKPLTKEYYSLHKGSKDGYAKKCKNCQIDKRKNIIKDGYKICKKCSRELPLNENYFKKDVSCLDGFRNTCLECNGLNFNPKRLEYWSKEEEEILIKYYPVMLNKDIKEKFLNNRECEDIQQHGNYLGLYKNKETLTGKNSPHFGKCYFTDERRKEQAEKVVRYMENNKDINLTKPQIIINKLLDDLNINYENEYNYKYYSLDNYLYDYNLIIEVQGDFFHCNPTIEKSNRNSRKDKILTKDKAKHSYIKNNHNIDVLYLWEYDIEKNIELCKALILEYINNNGKLENYHSFNYKLENDILLLNKNLYCIGY